MLAWEAWARNVPGLAQGQRRVLVELATLVDSRGVAKATTAYLTRSLDCHRSTLFRGLAGLEERGLLIRERNRSQRGTWEAGRIQLIRTPDRQNKPRQESGEKQPVRTLPSIPHGTLMPELTEEAIKGLICIAQNEDWQGEAANALAATLRTEGPKRFGRIIRQRRIFREAEDPWDTLTLAWEVLQTNAAQLLEAKKLWGLWATILSSSAQTEDAPRREDKENQNHLTGTIETEATAIELVGGTSTIGVDDICEIDLVHSFIQALVEAGMPEAVAWAGTAIVASRADLSQSDRHRLVGLDARLHTLGITPKSARSWMSALVGTRRGKPGIANLSKREIKEWATQIAQATRQAA